MMPYYTVLILISVVHLETIDEYLSIFDLNMVIKMEKFLLFIVDA